MRYKQIFARTLDGTILALKSGYSIAKILKFDPLYVQFCLDKVELKNQLEEDYKKYYRGLSFRVYLEDFVYEMINKRKFCPLAEIDFPFGDETKRIEKEILTRITKLYTQYKNIENELIDFMWTHKNNISDVFIDLGLKPYIFKYKFFGLYDLKNGEVKLKLFFNLNDELKKIFIESIKNDTGDKIADFTDPEIFEGSTLIFSAITHEDYYYFKNYK